jgi:hypothetical protein
MTAATVAAPLNVSWYADEKNPIPLGKTWPRRIFSPQQIPADFQDALPEVSSFPYVVFLPEQKGDFVETESPQMVALTGSELIYMTRENCDKPVISTTYPLAAITYVESGQSLFQAWLEIRTDSQVVMIVFPLIAEHLFTPIIDAILVREPQKDSQEFARSEHQPPAADLAYLRKANLKFFNAVKKYINDQEGILETAYQPEVEISNVRIFGWSLYKKSTTDHVSVLTDTAVILIKEGQETKNHERAGHGTILTYIPISQIKHAAFEEHSGKLDCVMNIVLSDNTSLRTKFSTRTTKNLEKFREACLRACDRPS